MLLELAWKNIWRNKTRSLVITTAIALGILGGLVASSVSFGMGDQMVQSAIGTRLSHLQIHHPGFADDHDVELTISRGAALADTLSSLRSVRAVSPRVVVTAMASSPVTASGVEALGVEPDRERAVSDIDEQIVEGDFFGGGRRNPAVIGRGLAKSLDAGVGSKIVLTFQDTSGTLTGGAFRVSGIFRTVSSEFDKTTVLVRATDLNRLLGLDSTAVHEMAILLDNNRLLDTTVALVGALAPEMKIDTWRTLAPELDYVAETIAASLYIFMAVILVALAFGIVNTMLMVVLERRRELGMLLAVGMHRRTVFGMIVLETVLLSLTGAVAGMALTAFVIAILSRTGINLSIFAEGLSEFGIGEVLYPSLPASMYAGLTLMVVVTAVAASVFPAVKALRLRPAQALRTV